jgi:hypothetical protein
MLIRGILRTSTVIWLLTYAGCATAGNQSEVSFPPELQDEDLSAAALVGGRHLLVASDEGKEIRVLSLTGPGWSFREVVSPIVLPVSSEEEVDIEAIAVEGRTVYVAGSHSLRRKKVDPELSQSKNRKRIASVKREENRDHVFRFQLDPETGAPIGMTKDSLRDYLISDPVLGRFTNIPGKENGVDIEGLSVVEGTLYVAFRSPVLRGNWVPVLKTRFGQSSVGELLFVDLGGKGIRDIARIPEGFLLLAGPPADAEGPYGLYFWSGREGLGGNDRGGRVTSELARIKVPRGGKAEGLAVVSSDGHCHELLILFDGVAGGAPQRLRACVPG